MFISCTISCTIYSLHEGKRYIKAEYHGNRYYKIYYSTIIYFVIKGIVATFLLRQKKWNSIQYITRNWTPKDQTIIGPNKIGTKFRFTKRVSPADRCSVKRDPHLYKTHFCSCLTEFMTKYQENTSLPLAALYVLNRDAQYGQMPGHD